MSLETDLFAFYIFSQIGSEKTVSQFQSEEQFLIEYTVKSSIEDDTQFHIYYCLEPPVHFEGELQLENKIYRMVTQPAEQDPKPEDITIVQAECRRWPHHVMVLSDQMLPLLRKLQSETVMVADFSEFEKVVREVQQTELIKAYEFYLKQNNQIKLALKDNSIFDYEYIFQKHHNLESCYSLLDKHYANDLNMRDLFLQINSPLPSEQRRKLSRLVTMAMFAKGSLLIDVIAKRGEALNEFSDLFTKFGKCCTIFSTIFGLTRKTSIPRWAQATKIELTVMFLTTATFLLEAPPAFRKCFELEDDDLSEDDELNLPPYAFY